MRITPCAALNDAFRARHFLLRPIIRFSTQWQALALAGGGGREALCSACPSSPFGQPAEGHCLMQMAVFQVAGLGTFGCLPGCSQRLHGVQQHLGASGPLLTACESLGAAMRAAVVAA